MSRDVAQVAKRLLSRHEALGSILNTRTTTKDDNDNGDGFNISLL